MTFVSEKLFDQKVSPLCQDELIRIKNGTTFHLSFDGCKFVRVEDAGMTPGCFQGTFANEAALPTPGQPCRWAFNEETDTIWFWSTATASRTNSGVATLSYIGLSDTTDIDYVGKANYVPAVNDAEDALTLQFVGSEVLPVIVDGQTIFALGQAIRLPGSNSRLYVNGKKANYGIQYIFTAANTLVWQDVGYTLDTNDTVELYHI